MSVHVVWLRVTKEVNEVDGVVSYSMFFAGEAGG